MLMVLPSNNEDIQVLADTLRDDVKLELEALSYTSPYSLIEQSVLNSKENYSVFFNKSLCGMFGVVPSSLLNNYATPWVLTSSNLDQHPRVLLKVSPYFTNRWLKEYGYLQNYVDARYEKTLRWLRWLKFTIHPAAPYGQKGNLFNKVTKEI